MPITKLRKNGASLKRLESDRQRRFALEYCIDHKARLAAIRAGYSKKSAHETARQLLKNPVIKAYIGKIERLAVEKLELDVEDATRQLHYALTREVRDFCDDEGFGLMPHELPEHVQSIIDGFEQEVQYHKDGSRTAKTKYKITPHAAAREQALKHKGLFAPEKHEHLGILCDYDSLPGSNGKPNPIEEKLAEVRLLEVESKAIEGEE